MANIARSFMLATVSDPAPLPLLRSSFSVTSEDLLSQSASGGPVSQKTRRNTPALPPSTFDTSVAVLEYLYETWISKKNDGVSCGGTCFLGLS